MTDVSVGLNEPIRTESRTVLALSARAYLYGRAEMHGSFLSLAAPGSDGLPRRVKSQTGQNGQLVVRDTVKI